MKAVTYQGIKNVEVKEVKDLRSKMQTILF